jgi:hypothetical protein
LSKQQLFRRARPSNIVIILLHQVGKYKYIKKGKFVFFILEGKFVMTWWAESCEEMQNTHFRWLGECSRECGGIHEGTNFGLNLGLSWPSVREEDEIGF